MYIHNISLSMFWSVMVSWFSISVCSWRQQMFVYYPLRFPNYSSPPANSHWIVNQASDTACPGEPHKLQVTDILRFTQAVTRCTQIFSPAELCHHGMTIDSVGGISHRVTDSDWWWWLRASFPPPQTNSSTRGLRLWQGPVFCALYLRWLKMVT